MHTGFGDLSLPIILNKGSRQADGRWEWYYIVWNENDLLLQEKQTRDRVVGGIIKHAWKAGSTAMRPI